jgi:hypothetical protein
MKKFLILLLIACVTYSCASTRSVTNKTQTTAESVAPGDGSSFENAIIIKEHTESTGVSAEYAWLRQNYPGYKLQKQALVNNKGVPYDVLDIVTGNGEKKSIYFNISRFFGKF